MPKARKTQIAPSRTGAPCFRMPNPRQGQGSWDLAFSRIFGEALPGPWLAWIGFRFRIVTSPIPVQRRHWRFVLWCSICKCIIKSSLSCIIGVHISYFSTNSWCEEVASGIHIVCIECLGLYAYIYIYVCKVTEVEYVCVYIYRVWASPFRVPRIFTVNSAMVPRLLEISSGSLPAFTQRKSL